MQKKNRAFEEMRRAAKEWLTVRDPREIAEHAEISFDPKRSEFTVPSFGEKLRMHWPDCEIMGASSEWHELLLLHYLYLADGTPLANSEWISFAELRNGMVRGGNFDRDSSTRLSKMLSVVSSAEIERVCHVLGAEMEESKADFCAVFSVFPRLPIRLKLWFADDEFPASACLLLRKAADHYLTIEGAVTAGEVLMAELERQLGKSQV